MKRFALRALGVLVLFAAAIYVFNASWRVAPVADPVVTLISHRGVHQTFHRKGLAGDTCTAERIDQPVHAYLENTIASMQVAFAAGADIVELDVHPTTDGRFAVMHDWTLDCRTDGTGETRSHDMAYLKTLDIGYGYTADGGETHPFRGKYVGQMPALTEVFEALPDGRFLINFKSRETREADMLAALTAANPGWRSAVWGAYGGDEPTYRAAELIDGLAVWSRRGLVDCLLQYEALGWTGFMPQACRDTKVMVPLNVAPFLWGWPNLYHCAAARYRQRGHPPGTLRGGRSRDGRHRYPRAARRGAQGLLRVPLDQQDRDHRPGGRRWKIERVRERAATSPIDGKRVGLYGQIPSSW